MRALTNAATLMALEPIAEAVSVGVLYMVLVVIASLSIGFALDWYLLARRVQARREKT